MTDSTELKVVNKLPSGEGLIGYRRVVKGMKSGKIEKVVVAKNCPDKLLNSLTNVEVEVFSGDQMQLGTSVGKPFPVAVIGFLKAKK